MFVLYNSLNEIIEFTFIIVLLHIFQRAFLFS
jgi:hypothetical protein